MNKPTVYLDTNIISAYCYRGEDNTALARRAVTCDWWETEREHFAVLASAITEDELAAGRFRRQSECLQFVHRLRFLPLTSNTRQIAERLLELRIIPDEKPDDALHMAVCAAHQVDYLLSWNYAHLVNPIAQKNLESMCAEFSIRAPLLVSPESIPKVRLGQSIRRRSK